MLISECPLATHCSHQTVVDRKRFRSLFQLTGAGLPTD